jgi:two-component system sensor histidine kinase UhpB
VELWGLERPPAELEPDVARVLRALASETRLDILRRLASGDVSAAFIANDLELPVATVRRHLEALARVGLVRAGRDSAGEVYELARHAVRLLNATLVYSLGGGAAPVRRGPAAVGSVPAPPFACTVCDNGGFVRGVLDDLGAALNEAREYHSRIQQMSSQVLTAHEAERKRIARELHDDTAQALTSILVRLRLLERSSNDEDVLRNAEELRDLTSSALDSVRRMAMDLRPASLDDLGLVPALEAYVERYCDNWPVRASVSAAGIRRRLPRDAELVLYRVVQEALTNIAKHASAKTARVRLSRRRNQVTLVVEDDGKGFEPESVQRSPGSGLGLFGMRERLALVGGDVRIESERGRGTRITARLPLAGQPRRPAETAG